MVHRIARTSITIPPRQRQERSPDDIPRLVDSILSKGLMHPPVFRTDGPRYVLVAGETRLLSIDAIGSRNLFFNCNGEVYLPGEVPAVLLSDLSTVQYAEAELEENLIRSELPWQDRIRALDTIHRMRTEANPGQIRPAGVREWGPKDTARELVEKGGIVGAGGTNRNVDAISERIHEATVIARHLHDPQIRKARNASEAYDLVVRREEAAFAAELVRRTNAATPRSSDWSVRKGSLMDILPKLEEKTFDLIIADPPYGIGADRGGFRSRTIQHHNYEDTPDEARRLVNCILLEGFRTTKPRANLFLFCDIDLFQWAKTLCQAAGWEPFRTPIIWAKSDSEGLAPWGRSGFRRTYEILLFATKGQRGLISSPVDILRHNRVSRSDREYGPEKPVELLRTLIECSTLPGDYILDPCCGSGSTLEAARATRRRALGIEIDEHAYNIALRKAQGIEEPEGSAPSVSAL